MTSALNPTRTLWGASFVVAASTLALPFVTGYGTTLSQTVVLGAWSIVAALTSDAFTNLHKPLVWLVAAALNVLLFLVPAAAILLSTRGARATSTRTVALVGWLVFYAASLFILFQATDGP
jgi:hypothetical protein